MSPRGRHARRGPFGNSLLTIAFELNSYVQMDSVAGVTEKQGSCQEALQKIGQQDEDGQTIGIVYMTSGVLSFFPIFFRALGLIFVLSLCGLHQPLGFLPEGAHWTSGALQG